MRKLKILLLLIICINFTSCEDVVQIDLEEGEPRLVVEGSILKHRDSSSPTGQFIRLSLTTPFYSDEIPSAVEASVEIYDETGNIFEFREAEPGLYINENFNPDVNTSYELKIVYEDEVYSATETFMTVPQLEYIEQNNNGGFLGDEIEFRAYYTDPEDTTNFYLFRFLHENLSLQIYDDKFTNGNQTFAVFADEDLVVGDTVIIENQGISKRFYEYMYILRSQAGSGGGPFQTQPTTVRGNIVNTTNADNFPFGYFRLSEVDELIYTVR